MSIARTLGGLAVALLGTAILCFTLVILIGTYSHDLGSWSRWYYIGVIIFAVISVTPFSLISSLILWVMIIGALVLGVPWFAISAAVAWGIVGWIIPPISDAIAGGYSGY